MAQSIINDALYYIHGMIPYFIAIIFMIVVIFISYGMGNYQSNKMWKSNLKYHIDDVVFDEIAERDTIIKSYKEEMYKLRKYKENTAGKIEAVLKILNE